MTHTLIEKTTPRWMTSLGALGPVFWVLFFLIVCRLLAMDVIPLNDSTEARYGEISRLMLATGNWVTPMQALGEPFWAKPPLSMWSQALSMGVFGVSALAARLPSLGWSIGILGLVAWLAFKRSGLESAKISVLVLAGTPFFFLNAGVVMTDPALLFCTTLCMVSAWLAQLEDKRCGWGYLFFVGLGLGLLAKGPLIGVLVGLPLVLWGITQRRCIKLMQRLPWVSGSVLMLAIALPWYLLAEYRTPGFLHYFIIGEHISRFIDPGWQGDKYGFAHAMPYGMIWVYALISVLPWSVIALIDFSKKRPHVTHRVASVAQDGWVSYLLFFALTPLLFFTVARNIIYPYTFPSLPAFALLFTEGMRRQAFPTLTVTRCAGVAAAVGAVFLLASVVFVVKPHWVAKSQNRVVMAWQKQAPPEGSKLLYWAYHPDYSGQFYSGGAIVATRELSTLMDYRLRHPRSYLVVKASELHEIPLSEQSQWERIATIEVLKHSMILFRI
jgi:4-amino-4-deoxy-L-arabinose transferase-like glycosyltransferase